VGTHPLDRLFETIVLRRSDDTKKSYTARLLNEGRGACAKKLGEEATETVIASLGADKAALAHESADLLYHLLVLWAACGLTPDDVYAELKRREGQSGLEEKAARGTRG
jgi:phosphoribosyl-ATP pyrophosphohydrolase